MDLSYQIPRVTLIWILLAVVLVILPQATRIPLWVSITGILCVGWRALIYSGQLNYPGRFIRALLVILTLLVSVSQARSLGVGLDAAASLLTLGFVFKLIEMRHKRDIYVVISLCFVMAMVAFLYSQSVVTTVYLFFVITVVTAAMISLNRSSLQLDNAGTARLALKISLQALPLTLVLFVVFPRIAPLWAVPIQSASAATGVSDEMSPGDISRLGRSGELAFRVQFEDAEPPEHQDLYWRGLVLDNFNGETWRRSRNSATYPTESSLAELQRQRDASVLTSGSSLYYNVILEPTQQPWVYGLHLAEAQTADLFQSSNFELFNNSLIAQRFSYDMRSFSSYTANPSLQTRVRNRNTRLPEDGNQRSREFAQELRSTVGSDREFANAVLAHFQQNEYFYTLNPALLATDRVDDFLFNTLEGFCEHYASSFTFLMRAVGIPARVVVGYQGAEYNRFENYLMVYQYNAHAWSEIYLEGEGWIRFDPTAAVSPARVELGVEEALRDDPAFLENGIFSAMRRADMDWLNSIRLRFDALEYEWNRRVVNYDQDLQFEFFERVFGDVTEQKVLLLLTGLASLVILILGFAVVRLEPRSKHDPLNRLYLMLCQELEKVQLPRHSGEGPIAYCDRVCAQRPDLQEPMSELTDLYVNLSYSQMSLDEAQLKSELKNFRNIFARLKLALSPFGRLKRGA